ncbi:MAG TPA: outer membrane beta-barrel protein [Casimicrobiaceae bacterium]|nr:outer membrane beta-barrel protein [Casimicrobiaceae bacterium]
MSRSACLVLLLSVALALSADPASAQRTSKGGFYGGIALRDNGSDQGLAFGEAGDPSRFAFPIAGTPASQATTLFGGYRWRNDLSIEAALASSDYRLPGGGGVGLMLPQTMDAGVRAWNVDVYGNWAFMRRLSLYGRLGYAQSDSTPAYATSAAFVSPDRRGRDGLSYGVGLRYDFNRSLGLKLEYARIGTQAADIGSLTLPDADQVQFGLQFRF